MRESKKRLTKRLAVTFAASVTVARMAAAAKAAPSALSRAAEKRAATAAALPAAAPAQEPQKKQDESLSFDPFAPAATPHGVAVAGAAPQANISASETDEAVKRQAARDAILSRLGSYRPQFLVQIMRVRATRRSPNSPPAFTPRRPSDPPGPPPNVPPGPPNHAPPGPPPGTPAAERGNGPNN